MTPATYEQRSRKNWQFKISYILGLALLLRSIFPILGYSYTRDATIFYTPDTASYILPARELIAYGRFFSDGSPQAAVWNTPVAPAPDTVRTPGYPLLLTAGLLLRRPEIVTIVLQILLSCFTVYMVYGTAFLLFENKRTALVAAALYAIEPLSILFSSLLAPETLFTAILAVAVYYLVRYLRRQSMVDLLISGCALAASVYVRPAGYFLPLVIATVLAAWALGTAQQNKPRLTANLNAFLIVSVGLTGLWQVRNYVAIGYSGFSSVFSEDLYCCSAASVLAAQQHLPYTEMQDRLACYNLGVYFQEHPEQKNWPVAQRFDYMNRAATRILLGSPLTYAWIYFEGVVRGAFDPGSTEFLRFFDLYPKDGGLLEIAVDKGIVKTLEALLLNPLLASEHGRAARTAVHVSFRCAGSGLPASHTGPWHSRGSVHNGLLFGYSRRPRRLGAVPPSCNAYHLRLGRGWSVRDVWPAETSIEGFPSHLCYSSSRRQRIGSIRRASRIIGRYRRNGRFQKAWSRTVLARLVQAPRFSSARGHLDEGPP